MNDIDVIEMLEAARKAGQFSNVDDCRGVLWYRDGGEVHYNLLSDEEDLANGDGETYSFKVYGMPIETGDFIVFKGAYLCTGHRQSFVFSKDSVFDVDQYWKEWDALQDSYHDVEEEE